MELLRTGPLKVNSFIVPLVRNFVFIVDPAGCRFSRDSNVISDYLKENNLVPVAVVLTHGHFDHVAGLPFICSSWPSLAVVIHKNDSNLIGADSKDEQSRHLELMGFEVFLPFVSELPGATGFLEDNKTLWDAIHAQLEQQFSGDEELFAELKEKAEQWVVLHTPGHTTGSCCLYNEMERLLISGDTVFYHSWGRCDLPGGNEMEMGKSLLRVAENVEDDTLVYPGHDMCGFKLEENL